MKKEMDITEKIIRRVKVSFKFELQCKKHIKNLMKTGIDEESAVIDLISWLLDIVDLSLQPTVKIEKKEKDVYEPDDEKIPEGYWTDIIKELKEDEKKELSKNV